MRKDSKFGFDQHVPYLEHFFEPGGPPERVRLQSLPFRIGRGQSCSYVLYLRQISKEHAEIYNKGGEFRIRDLGSINGTFVNGVRVDDSTITCGDIIHVGNIEFRFVNSKSPSIENSSGSHTALFQLRGDPTSMIRGYESVREMLANGYLRVVFQHIVELATTRAVAYEALGRGTHHTLGPNPAELFGLASECDLAADLSQAFRRAAFEEATQLPPGLMLFTNFHPAEMASPALAEALQEMKRVAPPQHPLVVEVHESFAADVKTMRRLRTILNQVAIGLAYDDFGIGQSRLVTLAEVPPDFVKIDRCLVSDIDRSKSRQDLARTICRYILDLGVQVIVEGIERPEEAQFFRELGCQFGQGYLFGRAQPAALVCESALA